MKRLTPASLALALLLLCLVADVLAVIVFGQAAQRLDYTRPPLNQTNVWTKGWVHTRTNR